MAWSFLLVVAVTAPPGGSPFAHTAPDIAPETSGNPAPRQELTIRSAWYAFCMARCDMSGASPAGLRAEEYANLALTHDQVLLMLRGLAPHGAAAVSELAARIRDNHSILKRRHTPPCPLQPPTTW